MRYLIFAAICCFCLATSSMPAFAQEKDVAVSSDAAGPSLLSRFLFSQEEIDKLRRALGGEFAREPEPQEEGDSVLPSASPRVLSLAGLIYSGPEDWMFWLNGTKNTPDAKMEELKHLYVTRHYVDFQWLDVQTNTLFPVRLRPNQSFHLDSKVFFTGTVDNSVGVSQED